MVELEYFDWKDLLFGKYCTAEHGVFKEQQTFLSSRRSDCQGGLDRQRRFWREIDTLGNKDGNILFIFPDWYFGALIFSYVNAAPKRPSKFAFDRSQ